MKTGIIVFLLACSFHAAAQKPELLVPRGHTSDVNAVAFSPDGNYILTGSDDNTAILWDLEGHELQVYNGHTGAVNAVCFSPDGQFLLTGSSDNTARLWDLYGRLQDTFTGHTKKISSVAFSPDGRHILTGSFDGTARVCEISSHQTLSIPADTKGLFSATFSPASPEDPHGGRYILTAGKDDTARLWDRSGRKIRAFAGHSKWVFAAAFSPNGQQLITGSMDNTAVLWSLSGLPLQTFSVPKGAFTSIAFSPAGDQIVTGGNNNAANLWDLSGNLIRTFEGHNGYTRTVVFSPDGKHILTGSDDRTAALWDLSGHKIQTFTGHAGAFNSMLLSPDETYVLTGGFNIPLQLWNLATHLVTPIDGHCGSVNAMAFSPDGNSILTAGINNTAIRWDLSGHALQTFSGHTGWITSLAFSPDGKKVLTGSWDKTVKLWTESGREIRTFTTHTGPIRDVAFTPDGNYVLTSSDDQTAILWDTAGQLVHTFSGHTGAVKSIALSPDGKYVLTGSDDQTAKLWSLQGQLVRTLSGHTGPVTSVRFVPAFTANSLEEPCILTGSEDKTATLWNLAGRPVQTFTGHSETISSAAFLGGGRYVLTGSLDRTFSLWDPASGNNFARFFILDSADWVVITASGLFDASPGAMELINYVAGLEVIELEQLKERYYEPGLLKKMLGMTGGGLRPVDKLDHVDLYPRIRDATIKGNLLRVQLEERSGGIGRVVLLLDDYIELDTNINPMGETDFDVSLNRYAGYFYADSVNHLSVRTYNREGWLKGPPYRIDYRPTAVGAKGNDNLISLSAKKNVKLEKIHLYALVVGTSHYRGGQLELKFPDKDAAVFADALRKTGAPLFRENITVNLLNTSADPWPRKTQIEQAIDAIADAAGPDDIFLVYFSGHGITYPPNSEKGRFYYLTTDILGDKLDDPATLNAQAIAQDTLQEWIRRVKARKRILILDACNSGRVVETLSPGAKALNSDQRRALERMKDRSGMFVMAGSAADKSSFEASRFGHGLLTYSLLNNMGIVAAANKNFIDVGQLFDRVREEVPRLAREIGREQNPELIGAESYAIGVVNDTVTIDVPQAKPVFVRAVFLENDKMKDLQHLSAAVNDKLEQLASEKESPLAFANVESIAGDHYYIGGMYQTNSDSISGAFILFLRDEEVGRFEFSEPALSIDAVAGHIVDRAFGLVQQRWNKR